MRGKFRMELILLFDWNKKVPVREIAEKTGIDDSTLYRYKSVHYPKAHKKALELNAKLRK